MIIIDRFEHSICILGHANYAEPGKDIVCAAVSILVQNLIQSIEELTADKIQYSMQPGTVHIRFGDLSEQAQLLMNSFFIGATAIAENYPENVVICASIEPHKKLWETGKQKP